MPIMDEIETLDEIIHADPLVKQALTYSALLSSNIGTIAIMSRGAINVVSLAYAWSDNKNDTVGDNVICLHSEKDVFAVTQMFISLLETRCPKEFGDANVMLKALTKTFKETLALISAEHDGSKPQ